MNELIKIEYQNDNPTVLARDLHEALEVKTSYKDWFPRMCEYGFTDGKDYCSILSNRSDGLPGKPRTDHQITLSMAKELCINEHRYVYRFGEGDSYDGARIDAYWTTPKTDMGAKGVDKHLRKLLLRGEGDAIIIDYQVGIFTDSKRYMIPRTEDEICEISLQNRGRTVQFKIRNEAGSYFRLTGGVEIEYDGGRT